MVATSDSGGRGCGGDNRTTTSSSIAFAISSSAGALSSDSRLIRQPMGTKNRLDRIYRTPVNKYEVVVHPVNLVNPV